MKNTKRPDFTHRQEKWLCSVVDDWYLCFKDVNITDPLKLDYLKEILKLRLCDDPKMEDKELTMEINNLFEWVGK